MWPLTSTKMAHPMMLCVKLGWSWHIGCGEENTLNDALWKVFFKEDGKEDGILKSLQQKYERQRRTSISDEL